MKTLRMAVLGTGFWANFQIPAWFEVNRQEVGATVELVALYNRTRSQAEAMAGKCVAWGAAGTPRVYDDADQYDRGHDPRPAPALAPLVIFARRGVLPGARGDARCVAGVH